MNNREKAKELLKKMSIDEKIAQMSCLVPTMFSKNCEVDKEKLEQLAPIGVGRLTQFSTPYLSGPVAVAKAYNAIQKYHVEKTRLGIPVLAQNECMSGLAFAHASNYPSQIALAATFDDNSAEEVGKILSKEAKAVGIRQVLGPICDITHDARWGRVEETFGEDKLLVSAMATKYVKGIQGEHYGDNVIATGKHFLGYGCAERGINPSHVPFGEREILDTVAVPFSRAINESKLEDVMVTYAPVEGLPMSVNKYYLQNVLRGKLGFDRFIICDGMSLPRTHESTKIGKDGKDVAKKALVAGVQADTPVTHYYKYLKELIEEDSSLEQYIDEAVLKVLEQKYELGLFDNPYVDVEKIKHIYEDNSTFKNIEKICEKAPVLLKNNGILPLDKNIKKIGIVGEVSNQLVPLFAAFSFPQYAEMFIGVACGQDAKMQGMGEPFKSIDIEQIRNMFNVDNNLPIEKNVENYLRNSYNMSSIYEAIKKEFSKAEIVLVDSDNVEDIRKKKSELESCDVIITCIHEDFAFIKKMSATGEPTQNSGTQINKTQKQMVAEAASYNVPLVMIALNGRPLNMYDEDKICDAILEMWHLNEETSAICSGILSGRINPSGKLPISFPSNEAQQPLYYSHPHMSGHLESNFEISHMDDYMKKGLSPLYHFGHGLSYTKFDIQSKSNLKEQIKIGSKFEIEVEIKNTGDMDGDEVIQIYSQTLDASILRPVLELRSFKRVNLKKGESQKLLFKFDSKEFGYYDFERNYILEPQKIRLFVGNSCSNLAKEYNFELIGDVLPLKETERVHEPEIIVL